MNMFKKTGGFTLVELIVVIAILAILAGVAIPAYSGYISKAQQAGDLTELNAIQTAVNAVFATEDYLPEKITVTEVTGGVTVVAAVNGADYNMHDANETYGERNIGSDFALFYSNDLTKVELDSVDNGTAVTWTKTNGWDLD